jgi:hypothetical protein
VTETRLLGVQIETPQGQLLDYGILEASVGSLRLVTPRLKGTLLGGAILVLLSSLYFGILIIPFLLFQVSPITGWDLFPRGLFVTAVPVGFVLIIFLGLGLARRVQVKYLKTSRNVKVLDIHPGQFRHELVVQSGEENMVLTTTGLRRKLLRAIALTEQHLPEEIGVKKQ